jgi:hypothetical protein
VSHAESIAERLVEVAPPIIASWTDTPSRCIAATAIGLEVFRHFGVSARPIALELQLFSPTVTAWILANHERGPLDWQQAPKGTVLVIGPESGKLSADGYNGHLVVGIDGWLVDLDARQFNRPEHGLELPAAVMIPADRPNGDGWICGVGNGCLFSFRPIDDASWRTAPDWTERRWKWYGKGGAVAEIIRAMR